MPWATSADRMRLWDRIRRRLEESTALGVAVGRSSMGSTNLLATAGTLRRVFSPFQVEKCLTDASNESLERSTAYKLRTWRKFLADISIAGVGSAGAPLCHSPRRHSLSPEPGLEAAGSFRHGAGQPAGGD